MKRISRAVAVALIVVVSAASALTATPQRAYAAVPAASLLEGFENSADQWTRVSGRPTVTNGTSVTEGSSSFSLGYDLSTGTTEVERSVVNAPVMSDPVKSLLMDLKGDSSYNTAYIKLRDASGELLMYRIDAMRSSSFYPVAIDLSRAPAASSGGNADGVLDAPFTFSRVLVVRNGSQPAVGTAVLDNLRMQASGWTLPEASLSSFAPDKGEKATFTFTASTGGDYRLVLRDAANRTRSLGGVAAEGGVSVDWDGLDDTGALMEGAIRGVFQQDETPDGALDAKRTQTGMPLATSVANASTVLVEGFDSSLSAWAVAVGTGTTSSSTAAKTNGTSAMKVAYDVSAADLELVRNTPPVFSNAPASALKVDVLGDGSYNTLYAKLRDASGEDFSYRLDSMRSATWATFSADLNKPPIATAGGNADKVLDLPVTLRGFSLVRNGTQPATGSFVLDNVRVVSTGWTTPVADPAYFDSAGDSDVNITFTAASAGDFSLALKDSEGRAKTIIGTASGPGEQVVTWDGRGDDGALLSGDVNASFAHDSSADASLSNTGTSEVGIAAVVTVAEVTASGVTVYGFDSSGADWAANSTVSVTSRADRTEGTGSLAFAYNASSGNALVESSATPQIIATSPISALKIDIRGDASYNTVFLRIRDATGESFLYRSNAMSLSRWSTSTVDLTKPPAKSELGNADGLLDYPLSLQGFNIARNGTTGSASGTVLLDNLRTVSEGWTLPASHKARFAASAGESTSLTFTAGLPGDYVLSLKDLSGRVLDIAGTAQVAGPVTVTWSGRDAGGVPLAGSVRGLLRYDRSPDGALTSPVSATNPYMTGVSARISETKPRSVVGMNSFLTSLDSGAEVDRQAALMENAFVRDAREEFEWKRVEPKDGYYDWAKFDRAVAATYSRNVQMIGKLVYSAPWASSAPAGTPASQVELYPPSDMTQYTSYISEVVKRYKDRVHIWEVWNEPNTTAYWQSGPDGAAYGAMLKASYTAIKAIDPSATVLVGGLAGFDRAFMQGIERAGAGSSYDGLAIHSYSRGAPEESGQVATWLDAAATYLERKAPGRSLWITEVGWPTCTTCSGATTEQNQADYLSRSYLDASARGVSGIAWYNLVGGTNPEARLDTFAVTTKDGRKKPAYEALRDIGVALHQSESTGEASASGAQPSVKVDDFATTSGYTAAGISGGSAKITSTTQRHGGTAGFKLDYGYTSTSKGSQISMSKTIAGEPTAVSIWVYGDGSMSPIYLKVADATGETFQGLVGNAGVAGWKKMTLFADGSNGNYTRSGGDRDGVWDYPLKLTSAFVYKGSNGVTSGSIFLDDVIADYGPNVHGTVLLNRAGTTQALYSFTPKEAAVQVSGPSAALKDADGSDPIVVTDGRVDVTLGTQPVFITSVASAAPRPAPRGTQVTVTWMGGERYTASVQIFTSSGALVRTLSSQAIYEAGRQSVAWDGNGANGMPAAVGNYTARITLLPTRGSSIFTTAAITIT
jgi:flagellar hook assembly protein FlgD